MLVTLFASDHRQAVAPRHCAFCSKPFPMVEGRVQLWRSTRGECFCSEFCADDAEERAFQSRGKMS